MKPIEALNNHESNLVLLRLTAGIQAVPNVPIMRDIYRLAVFGTIFYCNLRKGVDIAMCCLSSGKNMILRWYQGPKTKYPERAKLGFCADC